MAASHLERATRFMTALPALYRQSGEADWHRGLTRDISDTGVLFETPQPPPIESIIELTFHLPEQLGSLPAGQLTCVGKVVRHRESMAATAPRAAATFIELRSGDEA